MNYLSDKMKVGELIKLLNDYPSEMEVKIISEAIDGRNGFEIDRLTTCNNFGSEKKSLIIIAYTGS